MSTRPKTKRRVPIWLAVVLLSTGGCFLKGPGNHTPQRSTWCVEREPSTEEVPDVTSAPVDFCKLADKLGEGDGSARGEVVSSGVSAYWSSGDSAGSVGGAASDSAF